MGLIYRFMILFESFKEIGDICRRYGIPNWTINSDGLVDVDGDVYLSGCNLVRLPLRFGRVTGFFDCSNNQLISLEGGPLVVGRDFYCHNNQLKTLEGGPQEVDGNFYCHDNRLETLEGSPKKVGSSFDCGVNFLTTLEGGPEKVGRDFYCHNNRLVSLEGGPEEVGRYFYCNNNRLETLKGGPKEVGESFWCYNNPVHEIVMLFKSYKQFKTLLDDYSYLRGDRIIKIRFQEACIEAGIKMPKKIEGYDIV